MQTDDQHPRPARDRYYTRAQELMDGRGMDISKLARAMTPDWQQADIRATVRAAVRGQRAGKPTPLPSMDTVEALDRALTAEGELVGLWRDAMMEDTAVRILSGANPEIAGKWADGGEREARGLKHRAPEDTRHVPIPPPLVRIIRTHLAEFGWTDGYLVRAVRGGPVRTNVYGRAFKLARQAAFTPEQQASPLGRTPYDLRHACLSGWLNAGVQGAQVAEWAGHSVAVLYRVYAKCIDGDVDVQLRAGSR